MIGEVVTHTVENHIAVVQMIDHESSNTFSSALVQGLMQTFEHIAQNQDIRVVVIHGFDNYFCCGGTQAELLKLQAGQMQFDDLAFYRLLLDCPVPTIAAMQGHAIGGGLAFGCYADVIVLGEECIYSANFMKYGFTPGMGATYILRKKFGEVIANELMYTADTYLGAALKQKGIPVSVVRKATVITHALQVAEQIARKPYQALQLLKKNLTQAICRDLPQVIAQEVQMHNQTFITPDVKVRIEQQFGC